MHDFGFGYSGWGSMLAGAFLFTLLVLGLIFLIVWAARQGKGSERNIGNQGLYSAENILKARYAQGEISREQYLSMLEDLNT